MAICALARAGRTGVMGRALLLVLGMAVFLTVAGGLPGRAAEAVSPVSLVINNQSVPADVAPTIVAGRTLVPIRVVSEHLGALVVWRADTRDVHVTMGERRIRLSIDSNIAQINDQSAELDVAARIDSGRTMVPLRFVGEALGAKVGWNPTTRTVSVERTVSELAGVAFWPDPEAGRLILGLSRAADYRVTELAAGNGQPARLRIELDDSQLAITDEEIIIGAAGITRVLVAEPADGRVVVTAELTEAVEWRAERAGNGRDVVIRVGYKVTGVDYRFTPAGPAVFIDTNGPAAPRSFKLTDPHRLVVDVPHTTLSRRLPASLPVDNPMVSRIRVAQFEADTVRVVIDLNRAGEFLLRPADQGIAVHLFGRLQDVTWEMVGGQARLHLHGELPLGYHVRDEGHRLVIDVPHTELGMPAGRRPVDMGPVKAVTVQLMAADGTQARGSRVVVELSQPTGHQVVSNEPSDRVTLALSFSALHGRRIVVDPGHGGRDPGGVTASGVTEKELALVISQHLRNLLENAGAQVIMTRNSDVAVDLYDRAETANRSGADAFAAVHLNAFRHTEMHGTETYHHASSVEGRRLGQAVHQAMIQKLGRTDRGLRTANFVVLRETSMPAVLVEPLYLTYPQEERLALDPAVQLRIAQAVYEGLLEYFR
ncbi:MAG: N-acetylmuramoyl-L-alanine amidase family protein [Thermaerobacterales bacterium]